MPQGLGFLEDALLPKGGQHCAVVFGPLSRVLDSESWRVHSVEIWKTVAVEMALGDVNPCLSVVALQKAIAKSQVATPQLSVGEVGPDAIDGDGPGVVFLSVGWGLVAAVSGGDLFLQVVRLQHPGHGSCPDVAVGIHVDDKLFAIGSPGLDGSAEVINHGLDGLPISALSSEVLLVLDVDSGVTSSVFAWEICSHKASGGVVAPLEQLGAPAAEAFWVYGVICAPVDSLAKGGDCSASPQTFGARLVSLIAGQGCLDGGNAANAVPFIDAVLGWEHSGIKTHFGCQDGVSLPLLDSGPVSLGVLVAMKVDVEVPNVATEGSFTGWVFDVGIVPVRLVVVLRGQVATQSELFLVAVTDWDPGGARLCGVAGRERWGLWWWWLCHWDHRWGLWGDGGWRLEGGWWLRGDGWG